MGMTTNCSYPPHPSSDSILGAAFGYLLNPALPCPLRVIIRQGTFAAAALQFISTRPFGVCSQALTCPPCPSCSPSVLTQCQDEDPTHTGNA